ncbi:helix-turn-helix transcriptional regulator [Lentzea sp. NPDC059081]|uniref:helix-turn-helix transcriptional regulator n=1 Tax=Lentzea sp. NPDC059081 TaxID=3346719 RepID=UPI0036CF5036
MSQINPPRSHAGSTADGPGSRHRGRAYGDERARLEATFGAVLCVERAAKRWTQVRLAEAARITAASVYRLEKGRQRPSTSMTWKLARALREGCDLRTIVALDMRFRLAAGESLREFSTTPMRRRDRLAADLRAARELPVTEADPFASVLLSMLEDTWPRDAA